MTSVNVFSCAKNMFKKKLKCFFCFLWKTPKIKLQQYQTTTKMPCSICQQHGHNIRTCPSTDYQYASQSGLVVGAKARWNAMEMKIERGSVWPPPPLWRLCHDALYDNEVQYQNVLYGTGTPDWNNTTLNIIKLNQFVRRIQRMWNEKKYEPVAMFCPCAEDAYIKIY